jgi:phosphohistidine phosphatase
MLLLLIRHALAAERDSAKYPDDTLRPLVAKGRKVQARMALQLARKKLIPATILSSPWKRAWQTAGIVARGTGAGKKNRVPCSALAQDPNLLELAREIGPRGTDEIVALVGHEPWMSELAALLLAGSTSRPAINFPKSGIMGIPTESIGASSGMLRFFLTPRPI